MSNRDWTPADVSGKRQNRAMGAVTAAEKARIEADRTPPKRTIPPDLDGRVFVHRVGAGPDDEEPELLRRARLAYNSMAENLHDVFDRERAIMANDASTAANKVLSIDRVARQRSDAPSRKLSAVQKDLNAAIAEIDRTVENSFRARMKPEEQREIRDYVRSLGAEKRREFLGNADEDTVAAVLSGKHYLSGLGEQEANVLRRKITQRNFPTEMANRQKFQKAIEQIDRGHNIYLGSIGQLFNAKAGEIAERQRKAEEAMQ